MDGYLLAWHWLAQAAAGGTIVLVVGSLAAWFCTQPANRARIVLSTFTRSLAAVWLGYLPIAPKWFARVLTTAAPAEAAGPITTIGALRDRLLPPLDKALCALIRDLRCRGLLEETLIVCAGEFGRTPRVNGTAGRDHWPRAMTVLRAGGGIPGGSVYGATDAHGMAPFLDACSPDDLAATVFRRLGSGPATRSPLL
jgi:Protein of unknown function (DUF1501)